MADTRSLRQHALDMILMGPDERAAYLETVPRGEDDKTVIRELLNEYDTEDREHAQKMVDAAGGYNEQIWYDYIAQLLNNGLDEGRAAHIYELAQDLYLPDGPIEPVGGCSCRGRDLIAIFNGLHRSKKLRSRPAKKNISRK